MLVNPHSESQDEPHEHEPQQQKYETMQCFAVSEPKSIKEEGDGKEGEEEEEEQGRWCGKRKWTKSVWTSITVIFITPVMFLSIPYFNV